MKRNSERLSRKRSLRSFSGYSLSKTRITHQDLHSPPNPMRIISNSIYSTTKIFLQKTVDSFKYFASGGYQRLPKSTPCKRISLNNEPLHRDNYKKIGLAKGEKENSSNEDRKEKKIMHKGKKHQLHAKFSSNDFDLGCNVKHENTRYNLVAQMLRELEMMDTSNLDHVMDIEEAIHHYSRLTCTAYREIVDKFFMEMYSELFIMQASSSTKNIKAKAAQNKFDVVA